MKDKISENRPAFKALELPITLRIPFPDEVPMDKTILEKIKKSETANIVEGYTIKDNDENSGHSDLGFEFYSEINIDNSRLWELFIELANFLPSKIALISGHIDDDEINYGNYSDKQEVLDFLNNYKKELTADTFMKFGLLFYSDNLFAEVYVDETKCIKFWGNDKAKFENTLEKFNLRNIEDLEFIDEYPKVRQPLISLDETVIDTDELLEKLKNEYE